MYESNRTQHIQRKEDADDAGSSTNNQQDAANKFEPHDGRCHELGSGHAHLSECFSGSRKSSLIEFLPAVHEKSYA